MFRAWSQGGAREPGCRSNTLFSQTWCGEGGGRGEGEGGGEGDAAGFQKILLFSEILPLAVLEGKGCHVTCCQGPESAWGKCGRQR